MTKTAPKAKASATYFDQIKSTFEGFQNKMEVPAAAREFVVKGAEKTASGAESVHANVIKVVDGAESLTTKFVGGYANFLRGAFDLTLANVKASLSTLEKVAAAKSINEAVQIQADFVRENTAANIEKVREAAEVARAAAVESFKSVQGEVKTLTQKAAA